MIEDGGHLIIGVLEFSGREVSCAGLCCMFLHCFVFVCVYLRAQWDHCLADLSLPVLVLAGNGLLLSITDR